MIVTEVVDITNTPIYADEGRTWTHGDDAAAYAEGWGMWECSGSQDGPFQVQKFDMGDENGDGVPEWGDDADAWLIVGSGRMPHHRHAMDFLALANPHERDLIARHCAAVEVATAADVYLDVTDWSRERLRESVARMDAKRGPLGDYASGWRSHLVAEVIRRQQADVPRETLSPEEMAARHEVVAEILAVSPCPDCGVDVGHQHRAGCDVARCKECGTQALQCDEHPLTATTTWTGIWPGVVEATELDLWCYWGPPWIACTAGHRGAMPDLNRLAIACMDGTLVWDREQERFVRPTTNKEH